jgi:GTPase SAR1 family protein
LLQRNNITAAGAEALSTLTNLAHLALGDNNIGPDGAKVLSHLTALKLLDLNRNDIGDHCAEVISALEGLTELWLQGNDIGAEAAKGLTALTGLTSLHLDLNNIGDDGAKAISYLTGLTKLSLANNNIGADGGKAISSLAGLTQLYLDGNNIGADGAKAISSLANLTKLHLRGNNIGDNGAKALSALTHLVELNLERNSVSGEGAKTLSDVWAFATPPSQLEKLHLDGSVAPPLSLTPEVLRSGDAQAIFAAYRAAQQAAATNNSAQWNTAKLLVVGDETAGKISLIRFLVHNKPRIPDEKKTQGIELEERVDVTQWAPGGDGIILNIWDLAGQVRTHGTHRFFFSERCLYLLVLQDRREDDRSIDYWLKAILNRVRNVAILIVINKCDGDKEDLRLDEAHYKREYPSIIVFHRTACNNDHWSFGSITQLRSLISENLVTHPQLTHVRDPIPRHWLQVRDQIAVSVAGAARASVIDGSWSL